eukprot:274769-Rhodomonas_salina.2
MRVCSLLGADYVWLAAESFSMADVLELHRSEREAPRKKHPHLHIKCENARFSARFCTAQALFSALILRCRTALALRGEYGSSVWCYALSSTELRAMSGTARARATGVFCMRYAISGTVRYYAAGMVLRMCYALPGSDLGYAAIRLVPVLDQRSGRPDWYASVLRAPYAMSGTAIGYARTRAAPNAQYWHRLCVYALPGADVGDAATREEIQRRFSQRSVAESAGELTARRNQSQTPIISAQAVPETRVFAFDFWGGVRAYALLGTCGSSTKYLRTIPSTDLGV